MCMVGKLAASSSALASLADGNKSSHHDAHRIFMTGQKIQMSPV